MHQWIWTLWGCKESDMTERLTQYQGDYNMGFPRGSEVKASACNEGDLGSIPGVGKIPMEKGKATHSSILTCRIQWTV